MKNICKEALLHIPNSNYAYAYDEKTLHIRFRCKRGDIDKITLRIGDQYIWDEGGASGGNLNSLGKTWIGGTFINMIKEVETEYFDYWFAEYNPPKKRSRYSFILESKYEKLLYTERGIKILDGRQDEEKLCDIATFFAFPYLNKADILEVPKWVKDTIWYQIFPDRFCNGDENINPPNVEPWGSVPTNDNFMGGDLQGIINKLDYLKNLGINGIYLCPITKAHTNHRYDTISYLEIDPYLGDKTTFRKLVKEAHKRGIKIMLDAVFNHIGFYSDIWQDVIKNRENSKYKDWFYIHDFNRLGLDLEKMDSCNLPYETFGCVYTMPKLNTENKDVIKYLIEAGKYWVKEFDIDGWRLDVCNEVDHKFWRRFREELKYIKKDLYILGEIWHNGLPWISNNQFDSVMNYPLSEAMRDLFCTNKLDIKEFEHTLNEVLINYPKQANEVMFNLLGSHDTTRIISFANNNKGKFKLAYLFMFTQVGCPCIYYGDEIGMSGIQGDNINLNRRCMEWCEDKQDKEILRFMKEIINLRKQNEDFKIINNTWINNYIEENIIIYRKGNTIVIMNNSDDFKEIDLPKYLINNMVKDLILNKILKLKESLTLNPYDYKVYKYI